MSAAKAEWEAKKSRKDLSWRLTGELTTKWPVPMTSVMSLVTRFYRILCQHAPNGVYQTRFSWWENDKCWMVWRDSNADVGGPYSPLQLVVRPADSTQEGGGNAHWLQCRQMLTEAGPTASFHRGVPQSDDELPGGYWCRGVPAQMNDNMKWAQRLTQLYQAAAVWFIFIVYFSYLFISFHSFQFCLSIFISQWDEEWQGGGAPLSRNLAWRQRGYLVLLYSSKSVYSMNEQQQQSLCCPFSEMLVRIFVCETRNTDKILVLNCADRVDQCLGRPWRITISGSHHSSLSFLNTPAAQSVGCWLLSTMIWIYPYRMKCYIVYLLLPVLSTIFKSASVSIVLVAAFAALLWTNWCMCFCCVSAGGTFCEAPVGRLDSNLLAPGCGVSESRIISCRRHEADDNKKKWDILRNI